MKNFGMYDRRPESPKDRLSERITARTWPGEQKQRFILHCIIVALTAIYYS